MSDNRPAVDVDDLWAKWIETKRERDEARAAADGYRAELELLKEKMEEIQDRLDFFENNYKD